MQTNADYSIKRHYLIGVNNKLGQKIKKADQNWFSSETLKKIAAVALIALVVFGCFIPPVMAFQPNSQTIQDGSCLVPANSYLQPYTSQRDFSIQPLMSEPIAQFPRYVNRFMLVGLMSGVGGDLCEIPKGPLPPFKECDTFAAAMHESFKIQYPQRYQEVLQDHAGAIEGGFALEGENRYFKKVTVGMLERKVSNYHRALRHVEKTVLADSFLQMDEKAILQAIKKTNKLLADQLAEDPGKWRKKVAMISDGSLDLTIEGIERAIIERGGSDENIAHFRSYLKKAEEGEDEFPEDISEEEIETMRMVFYISCWPHEVEPKMHQLAKNIRELVPKVINREVDAVAVAAYVHLELGTIHPFYDANGRLARIWMNAILQLGGYPAIAIPNDKEYTAAIIADQKSPGCFVNYLEKVITWNREQSVLREAFNQGLPSANSKTK